MRFAPALLVSALLCSALPQGAQAQEAARFRTNTFAPWQPTGDGLARPDSVRRKVGYQHGKGGAIGGSVGALARLVGAASPRYRWEAQSADSLGE